MKEKEPKNAEAVIKDIHRRTKRKFSSEEKIRIIIFMAQFIVYSRCTKF
jgi:hypothetical protein